MSKNYLQTFTITHETALKAVELAIAEGAKQGLAISVAIVDPSLTLVAFTKMDGATPHSVETSRRKANTAASTRKPTGWMPEAIAIALPLAANNLLTNIPGGLPLHFDGKLIGGLGIAGGTIEQDETIAKVVMSSLELHPLL